MGSPLPHLPKRRLMPQVNDAIMSDMNGCDWPKTVMIKELPNMAFGLPPYGGNSHRPRPCLGAFLYGGDNEVA